MSRGYLDPGGIWIQGVFGISFFLFFLSGGICPGGNYPGNICSRTI